MNATALINAIKSGIDRPASSVATGELAGSATALQLPSVAGRMVRLKAHTTNAGNVYIGPSGVTKPDGSTDTTTGCQH